MSHRRGRRSPPGKFKQAVRGYIFSHTWRDNELKETICKCTRSEIQTFMKTNKGLPIHWIPLVEPGLVLSDMHNSIDLWNEDKEFCWCGTPLRDFYLTCEECGAIHPFK